MTALSIMNPLAGFAGYARKRSYRLLTLCLLQFVLISNGFAQIQAVRIDPQRIISYGLPISEIPASGENSPEFVPALPVPEDEVPPEEALEPENEFERSQRRFQALLQISVDRLPGTILTAIAEHSFQELTQPGDFDKTVLEEDHEVPETLGNQDKKLVSADLAFPPENKEFGESWEPWIVSWPDEKWTVRAEKLSLQITLGDWESVSDFTQGKALDPDQSREFYRFLLQSLITPPQTPETFRLQQTLRGASPIHQTLTLEDIVSLAELAPAAELNNEALQLLGGMLKIALESEGASLPAALERVESGFAGIGGSEGTEAAVTLLLAAGQVEAAERLLSQLPVSDLNLSTLQSLADFAWLKFQEAPEDTRQLQEAWAWSLRWLSRANAEKVDPEQKSAALELVAQIVPKIPDRQAIEWIQNKFNQSPDLILFLISSAATNYSQLTLAGPSDQREVFLNQIQLYIQAVSPVLSEDIHPGLKAVSTLCASLWLKEMEVFKQQGAVAGPNNMYARRDPFGNIYYQNYNNRPNNNGIQPLDAKVLKRLAPGKEWDLLILESVQPRILVAKIELEILDGEPEQAVSMIQSLALFWKEEAYRLANDLLRAWPQRFNPTLYQGPVMGGTRLVNPYGQNNATGIPMTRLIQERHLKRFNVTLGGLLEISFEKPLDSAALAQAFISTHSPAEVFDLTDIKNIFGTPETWSAELFYQLAQEMRSRLATVWRDPQSQQQAKRKPSETMEVVLDGYSTLENLIESRLAKSGDDWKVSLLGAMTQFDLAEYEYGLEAPLQEYTERRDRSFDLFQKAASQYSQAVEGMMPSDYSVEVFQQWFNSCLGASDLGYLTRQQIPDQSRLQSLKSMLHSLPDIALDWHLEKIGTGFAESILQIKPELKPRYLRAGVEIVGDHPSVESARELVVFYDSLLEEIHFEAYLDGDSTVDAKSPFGMFLTLRHTEDIEREAGGFGKYVQNQQSAAMNYYAQSGAVNYRNDLDNAIRSALSESFEIVALTFHDALAPSRPLSREGWRETPVAYVAMQIKDSAVDRIPSIQLDLDFADGFGQVILPVETSPLLIDARDRGPNPVSRPVSNVEFTLLLDDRDWEQGQLTLEVEAHAQGILGELSSLLNPEVAGFEIQSVEDTGLALDRLDSAGVELTAVSERRWLIQYQRNEYLSETGSQAGAGILFKYPKPVKNSEISGDVQVTYKRYQDKDIVEVKPEVALAGISTNLSPQAWWKKMAPMGLAALLGIVVLIFIIWMQKPINVPNEGKAHWHIPSRLTPFNVNRTLHQWMEDPDCDWSPSELKELQSDIAQIESIYFKMGIDPNANNEFDDQDGTEIELGKVFHKWLARVHT